MVQQLRTLRQEQLETWDWIREETDEFLARFPEPAQVTPAVALSWEALERQLSSLAGCPAKKALVQPLLSATRKQAWCKPPEMVMREILVIAGVLQDESFEPGAAEEERHGGDFPMT